MCMCVCVHLHIYKYIFFMCTYIYVLNFPIFCAIWLKKCDFLTEKLGIKPDPDPSKSSGYDRIRIHNTGLPPRQDGADLPAGSGEARSQQRGSAR
jgi:hypothetical protein